MFCFTFPKLYLSGSIFDPSGGKLEGWRVLQENPDEGDAQIVEKILGMRTVTRQVPKEVGLTDCLERCCRHFMW